MTVFDRSSLEELSPEQLDQILAWISEITQERQLRADFVARLDEVQRDAIDEGAVTVHVDGEEWSQPSGVWDAYPLGGVVKLSRKTWRSTVPNNVWRPGQAGWVRVTADGVMAWHQPTEATSAFKQGDRVRFDDGTIRVSLIDGNVWHPDVYPSGWSEPERDSDESGNGAGSEQPQPGATGGDDSGGSDSGVREWKQPQGAHDAYKKGDRVTFEGTVYESVIDGNVWSPRDYPVGWKADK